MTTPDLAALHNARLPGAVRDMAERLGLPAALDLVGKLGGTTIPVPMRTTALGEARYKHLAALVGEDVAGGLCYHYPGTDLYVPNCRQALADARDAALCRERDQLATRGRAERDIVAELALRYRLSDRQVWRILKKPTRPASPALFKAQGRLY